MDGTLICNILKRLCHQVNVSNAKYTEYQNENDYRDLGHKGQQAATLLHAAAERKSVGVVWRQTPRARAIELFVL